MKVRVLLLLGGGLVLAGCGGNSANGHASPTARSTAKATVLAVTPGTLVSLKPTPERTTPVVAAPTANPGKDPYAAGVLDLKVGQFAAAISAFNIAVARHSHEAASWAGIGTAQLAQIHYVAATQSFQKAAKLDPNTAEYAYQAAYSALYSGDYHTALRYGDAFLKKAPNDFKGWHLLFLAYGDLHDAKDQLKAAQKVAALEPNTANAFNDLGIAYGNNSKFEPAINAFRQAIKLQPNNPQYWQNLGVIEYRDAKLRPALADLEKARSLTTNAALRKNLEVAIAFLQKATAPKKK